MKYEVVVHFNDETSYDPTVEAETPLQAIREALGLPEVWRLAYAVTHVEVQES
jgi:hypothetical protein